MKTTVRRRTFCFTKRTQKEIDALSQEFGETESQILQRAISYLYNTIFIEQEIKVINGNDN